MAVLKSSLVRFNVERAVINRSSNKNGLLILLLGILLLSANLITGTRWAHENKCLIWRIPSFLIVLSAAYSSTYKSLFLNYLWNVSYSIYLVQVFTIPGFYKLSSKYPTFIQEDILSLICLGASCFFGCLIYELAEKPLTNLSRKIVSKSEIIRVKNF